MSWSLASLYTFERTALLEALRRDLRAQERQAETDTEYAEYYRQNARTTKRLLEVLNPKAPRIDTEQIEFSTSV